MMPNRAWRDPALPINSSATDIRTSSRVTSVVEIRHRPHHLSLLGLGQLRVDRQRPPLGGRRLRRGEAAPPVAQVAETRLQVQCQPTINRAPDPAGPEALPPRVPEGDPG